MGGSGQADSGGETPAPLSASDGQAKGSLPTKLFAAYGVVAAPYEMLRAPALAILPSLYAKEFGFAMATISIAMLFLRLSDGVIDLAVGILSDRTNSAWGRRKPWLIASIFVAIPAAYGLYVPGDSPTIWSFTICYFFFFLAWAMFETPYTAWSAELAPGYEDRSRLAVWRGLGQNAGLILLSLVPLLPFLPSTEMNFPALNAMFWLIALAYPLGILYATMMLPNGGSVEKAEKFSFRETISAIRANRPFQLFLLVAFISDFGMGLGGALFFLFFDSYLGLGAYFTLIFVASIGASTVSLPLWRYLLKRTSKTGVLLVSLVGGALGSVLIIFLDPGPHALVYYIVYLALYYILAVARDVALYAIFGDIVDYDTLKSNGSRAGVYSSAWMVLRKIAYAASPAIAFLIAGLFGYDPSAKSQSDLAIFGLKAANGYFPAIFLIASAVFAALFPITKARHQIIRRRLEQRSLRNPAGSG
jgi:Na+/melibiose symporter-like transporter